MGRGEGGAMYAGLLPDGRVFEAVRDAHGNTVDAGKLRKQRAETLTPPGLRRDHVEQSLQDAERGVNARGVHREVRFMPFRVLRWDQGTNADRAVPQAAVMCADIADGVQVGQPRFKDVFIAAQ